MRARGWLGAALVILLLVAVALVAAAIAAAPPSRRGAAARLRAAPPAAAVAGGGPSSRRAACPKRKLGRPKTASPSSASHPLTAKPWSVFNYGRADRPRLVDAEGARVSPSLEVVEQWMAHEFLRPGDRVLELGARYGSVSITAARRVGPRGRVVAVEPDARVLPALERNREANGADFLIRWGTLSARPMRVETAHEAGGARNYSTFTTPRGEKSGGPPVLQTAELEAAAGGPFTALIADCEGCLCEVPALPLLLGRLRVVLLEADAPQRCNYGRIRRALLAAGLRQAFGGQGHYQAWVRDE